MVHTEVSKDRERTTEGSRPYAGQTRKPAKPPTSILRGFDADRVGSAARAESRRRERTLPVTSLYRWWARRTAAVTNGLLEAATRTLGQADLTVLDPFAGGGVIATSALLSGHRVVAQEIDPWAARNLAIMTTPGRGDELGSVLSGIRNRLELMGDPYITTSSVGAPARLAATFWVAGTKCLCGKQTRIFPAAVISRTSRIDRRGGGGFAWFACRAGHVHSHVTEDHPCPNCGLQIRVGDRYTTGRRIECIKCSAEHRLSALMSAELNWEPVLVLRAADEGDEWGPPTADELITIERPRPDVRFGLVPDYGEAAVLRRHGFKDFADLYTARQLSVFSALIEASDEVENVSDWARQVGRSCVIGSAEFAGLATRWDSSYLKPYESIAAHRYALTTLSAEIDPLSERGRGTIPRRIAAAERAASWLRVAAVPRVVHRRSPVSPRRPAPKGLTVVTGSSAAVPLPDRSVPLILTDPPYHDDVQYSDLASLFRCWSGDGPGPLDGDVTATRSTTVSEFQSSLSSVFQECRRVVTDDGHMVLSFANRNPEAWQALIGALDEAGWHFAGFEVVHSENETEQSKRNRRSCTLDVIVDVTPTRPARRYRPARAAVSVEESYCFAVGSHLYKIGRLERNWGESLVRDLGHHQFLAPTAVSAVRNAAS